MMRLNIALVALLSMSMLWACNSANDQSTNGHSVADDGYTPPEEASAEQIAERIEQLEGLLFSKGLDPELNEGYAKEVLTLYVGYADANPLDDKSAEYLFKAGSVATGLGQYQDAITHYQRIRKNYKDYPRIPECIFTIALTYERDLNQRGMAREVYQELIAEFPDSPLAADAATSIELLEMSDEELIERLKSRNQEQATN